MGTVNSTILSIVLFFSLYVEEVEILHR